MNLLVGVRQYLLHGALAAQRETGAAGAAHAKHVPIDNALELVVLLQESDQHLIGRRAVCAAPRSRQNPISLRAIGHDGGVLDERHTRTGSLHDAGTGAHIAACLILGGGGGEQQLLRNEPLQQFAMPWAIACMPHQDRNHDLMHGKDHRRGGAGLAEHVAHVNHVGDACALAAELDWDHHSKQALRARGCEGFRRKACVTVDGIAVFRRRRGDNLGASLQILRAGQG